ncbi:AAA family ATPase [Yaniella halotolerans]|uniref:AAA family ATPase n=1 Tax=Yaniella halotolerans TaxID=225453 RepID=UPI0003B5E7A6|nr:ATPase [Yaniella halotolerans]
MQTLNVATTINPRFDHVTPIEATRSAVTISNRCHVIAELMAVARSGLVDVVLVANDLEMVSLETLQQLADGDGYGPKVAAISDIPEDRQRLSALGIPVTSPDLPGTELVQWIQEVHRSVGAVEPSAELSSDDLRFLEDVSLDAQSVPEDIKQSHTTGRRGRRAAPYDPALDLQAASLPNQRTDDSGQTAADDAPVLPMDPGSEQQDEVPNDHPLPVEEAVVESQRAPLGNVTAVWGPIGAPGVTTIAVNLAVESALAGHKTLLIDADTYGAAVAVHLGLLDDTAAIAQACRAAEHHGIDASSLAKFAQHVTVGGTHVDVITGLTRAERWPQLRAAAWTEMLQAARAGWDQVIIDCGFGLEEDEELSFDIPAPQRNATTVTAVRTADTVIAVGTGDPVGFARFMKGLELLRETAQTQIVPVMNKVTAMTTGVGPKHQLTGVWERFGPSDALDHFIPWAPEVVAAALLTGRTLAESAPKSELRNGIRKLMRACAPAVTPLSSTNQPGEKVKTARLRRAVSTFKERLVRSR